MSATMAIFRKRCPSSPVLIYPYRFAFRRPYLAFGAFGVLLGEQWESIRVGNGHLSYRVGRVAWVRRQGELFAFSVVLF